MGSVLSAPAAPRGFQPSWPVAGRSITPTSASDSRAIDGPGTWATGNSAKRTNPGLWPWHRLIHNSAPEDQLPLCGGSRAALGLRGCTQPAEASGGPRAGLSGAPAAEALRAMTAGRRDCVGLQGDRVGSSHVHTEHVCFWLQFSMRG